MLLDAHAMDMSIIKVAGEADYYRRNENRPEGFPGAVTGLRLRDAYTVTTLHIRTA